MQTQEMKQKNKKKKLHLQIQKQNKRTNIHTYIQSNKFLFVLSYFLKSTGTKYKLNYTEIVVRWVFGVAMKATAVSEQCRLVHEKCGESSASSSSSSIDAYSDFI